MDGSIPHASHDSCHCPWVVMGVEMPCSVQTTEHGINWEGASVRWKGTGFWQRRTAEAIHIRRSNPTMNLDSGLVLPMVWNSILDT